MASPGIDVFVSYKREDRDRITPLIARLRDSGLNTWWDLDIPGGSGWRPEIRKCLDNAKCVVVVWSEQAVAPDAEFVHDQASVGHKRGVLLRIRIDHVAPPLRFGQVQCLDLVGWTGDPDDVRVTNVADAAPARAACSPPPPPLTLVSTSLSGLRSQVGHEAGDPGRLSRNKAAVSGVSAAVTAGEDKTSPGAGARDAGAPSRPVLIASE